MQIQHSVQGTVMFLKALFGHELKRTHNPIHLIYWAAYNFTKNSPIPMADSLFLLQKLNTLFGSHYRIIYGQRHKYSTVSEEGAYSIA